MTTPPSFLAAGQRFVRTGHQHWRANEQLTILVVGKDPAGHVWVSFQGPDGQCRTRLASLFETAVAAGEIVPVANGPLTCC